MRAAVAQPISSLVWLVAVLALACVGIGVLVSQLGTLGPAARGSWASSDVLLADQTSSDASSQALVSAISQLPEHQPIVVIAPVSEVEHWSGVWYLVGYLGWPHPVSSLLCRTTGQMNDYPPPPGLEAPAGTTAVLLEEHPDWMAEPTVLSPNLAIVTTTASRPWNSFCQ
jgi:hypothetical protein